MMTDIASHDEDATDDRKQQFLLDENRHRAKRSSERERAHIAHEDLGRVRVVPEETKARTDQRSAEHRQLSGRWESTSSR